jgi:3-dehydroquinate synthase class II
VEERVDFLDHMRSEVENFVIAQETDTIHLSAISGIPVPVTGQTPGDTINATAQYTVTNRWNPSSSKFIVA